MEEEEGQHENGRPQPGNLQQSDDVHPPQLQRGFSTPTHAKDMSKSSLTLPNDSQFARLEGSGPDQKLQSRDSMTLNILRETSQRPFPVSNLGGLSDDDAEGLTQESGKFPEPFKVPGLHGFSFGSLPTTPMSSNILDVPRSARPSPAGSRTSAIGSERGRNTIKESSKVAMRIGAITSYVRSRLMIIFDDQITPQIDALLATNDMTEQITSFSYENGQPQLLFFYQHQKISETQKTPEPVLFSPNLEIDRPEGRCIYFVRMVAGDINADQFESDVSIGEFSSPHEAIDLLLSELHGSILHSRHYDWHGLNEASIDVCLATMDHLLNQVQQTVSDLYGGMQLAAVDQWLLDDDRAKNELWNKLALDDHTFLYLSSVLEGWCSQVELLLQENDLDRTAPDSQEQKNAIVLGPRTEVASWRKRSVKLGGVVEQLKSQQAKIVLSVTGAGKAKAMKRWKEKEEILNETYALAKENFRLISDVDKYLEPLYSGTAEQIQDCLPGLLMKFRALARDSRYYKSRRRIERFLSKTANQLISGCRRSIQNRGKLLEREPDQAIASVQKSSSLCETFRSLVVVSKERLTSHSKSKAYDFSTDLVFVQLQHFEVRLSKLCNLLVTIQQFSTLKNTGIQELEALYADFLRAVELWRTMPYDLLDFVDMGKAFDNDFLEFNSKITNIEVTLRDFIAHTFAAVQNIDVALDLISKLETVLQRDTLKGDLEDKYSLIFQHYGDELENVQIVYDSQKSNPPLSRNLPPVAGNILWARHLLTKIEEPMQRFQSNRVILAANESKKIVRHFNRVAKTLIQFETMWYKAWCDSVEASKSGLLATLLVRHPDNPSQYVVNFDREVMQLLREAKVLIRLGLPIPENILLLLQQETRFKKCQDELQHFLDQLNELQENTPSKCKALLAQHFADLDRLVRPGVLTLTWQSMNVDGYFHKIYGVMHRLQELVANVREIMNHSVDGNLKMMRRMILLEFPDEGQFNLSEFVDMQTDIVRDKGLDLKRLRDNIENGIEEMLEAISTYTLDSGACPVLKVEDVNRLTEHYGDLLYSAILGAVKNSFAAIKKRLASRRSSRFMLIDRPFFDIEILLQVPKIKLQPSLDDVQYAIDETARMVLRCIKCVPLLGEKTDVGEFDEEIPEYCGQNSYFYRISGDKEVTCVCLMLCGSVDGTRRSVMEYLQTFNKFEFLWSEDKAIGFKAFLASNPKIDDFERELKRFSEIEDAIMSIDEVYNLSCMSLRTQSLKYSLKAEASAWKVQYAKRLHARAKAQIDDVVEYLRINTQRLSKEVSHVDDVGNTLKWLRELRQREMDLEQQMAPIEHMYYVLRQYNIRMPKEETETLFNLRPMWNDLLLLGQVRTAKLSNLQAGFRREVVRAVKLFSLDVMQFCNDFDMNGPTVAGLMPVEAQIRLKKYCSIFEEKDSRMAELQEREMLFGLVVTEYADLKRVQSELGLLNLLYSLHSRVEQEISSFSERLWTLIPSSFNNISTTLHALQADLQALPRVLREWPAYDDLSKSIFDFISILPVLQNLCHPGIRRRHWMQIISAAGQQTSTWNIDPETFKLKHVMSLNPSKIKVEIDEICRTAKKELEVESKVHGLGEQWTDRQFQFADYKGRIGAILDPKSILDIMKKLDESIADLAVLSSTKVAEALSEEVDSWMAKLSAVSEVIESWNYVQTKWTFMETIFSDTHLSEELPHDAKRFQKVDVNYMKLVSRVSHNRHVINCCNSDHQLRSLLPHLTEQLEQCERSLAVYLEVKRETFPRFYFVSDHVLLEFLTRTKAAAEKGLQHQLSTIFAGITGFRMDQDENADVGDDNQEFLLVTHVVATRGVAKEELCLLNPVDTEGGIDVWLSKVDTQTQITIKALVNDAMRSGDKFMPAELVLHFPAQICALVLHLNWTNESFVALQKIRNDSNSVTNANKRNSIVVAELVGMLGAYHNIEPHHRLSVENLVIVTMHLRDVFQDIVEKKVMSEQDFDFLKTARLEVDSDSKSLCVLCAGTEVGYGYDYEGLSSRAVITPVTDRCTISFLHALMACVCGAFVGPADVGKMFAVKEISKLVGRYVVVFNCNQYLDLAYLERCFKGLPACGCFGCFDEFNRLASAVLSACAQQLSQVLAVVREKRHSLNFADIMKQQHVTSAHDLRLGLFMTFSNDCNDSRTDMRSLGNLRGLLRTFAINKLETEVVISVILAASGFQQHAKLALKLKTLYEATAIQLAGSKRMSSFGVRNLVTVVKVASKMRLESAKIVEADIEKNEIECIVHAIRVVNIPRMSATDKGIFSALVGDLFLGLDTPSESDQNLTEAITSHLRKQRMDKHVTWMEKIMQLYAIMEVNHGVMVLSGSSLGKSSMISTLLQAQQQIAQKVQTARKDESSAQFSIQRIYSKSLSVQQLYGWRDEVSQQWHDGTFTFLWRRARSQLEMSTWLVLDGPIDPIWAENLNTALDDKILMLANGDRGAMQNSTRVIFESDKIENASPATMSRVGVIWVPSTALPWRSFVNKWIEERGSEERLTLRSLFDRYMDQLLHFQKMQCSPVVNMPTIYVPWMLTNMFDCASKYLDFRWDATGEVFIEKIFIFCLCWSFGGLLETMDRAKLSQFMYTLTDLLPIMKSDNTLFDFYPDDNVLDWEHWRNRIPEWKYPKDFDPTALFLSTEDTCRTDFLLRLFTSQRLNLLVTGATASCKSLNLCQFISALDDDKYISAVVAVSHASQPASLLDKIFNVVGKRQGRTYGPEAGKSCVLVVEDVNLTPSDKYGDQQNCELMRQLIKENGYYDLQKPSDWASVMGINYICVMTHPLSTHRDIPMRFKGQLCALNMTVPSDSSLNTALTRVFDRHFSKAFSKKSGSPVIGIAKMLPEATIALCKSLKQALVSNDSKIHYSFNLHDIMRVVKGILQCNPTEYPTGEHLIRLWRHECERVFSDKLVSLEHRTTVLDSIQNILRHKSFDEINREQCLAEEYDRFGSFFREKKDKKADLGYGVLPDMDTLADKLEELQAKEKMSCPLYDEAIEHVLRIARVLSMRRGSVILVGPLSSGRASISRLAAAVAASKFFDPENLSMRGGGRHMDCIYEAYRIAGIEARSVTVLLYVDRTFDDTILDKINHFLLTGDFPGAIDRKELDAIADDMRSTLKSSSTILSDRQIFSMFEGRARDNMHVILCCRPEDPAFQDVMYRFPNLLSLCQTVWILPWSDDTLKDVAMIHLTDLTVDLSIEMLVLCEYASRVHTLIQAKIPEYTTSTSRQVYITPRTFLAFINAFKIISEKQAKVLEDRSQRVQTALKKLRDAGYQVSEMKNELIQQERALQEATELTAERLKIISVSTMNAERKKGEVQEAKKKISERAHEIQQARADLEADLESAKPLLFEAQGALESVSREDILHLASQKSQPMVVKLVLDTILIVFRHTIRPTEMQDSRSFRDSFAYAMEFMSDPYFYERLQSIECDSMNGETAELLAPYFRHRDFNVEKVKSVSVPAASIALWVQTMARYYDATGQIFPKILAIDAQEDNLEEDYEALDMQIEDLEECQAELDELNTQFEGTMARRHELKEEAAATKNKLSSSTLLLTGLQEERASWIQETEESHEEADRLPGDCGIASAMMVYLGPFNREARAVLLQSVSALCHEKSIPFSAELHVPKFFTTQNEISSWFVQGLPCDEFSIQNGMLALYCRRFPLLIDPQEQFRRWIKLRDNPRVISPFTSQNVFNSTLAECMSYGRVLVYEGIENTVSADLEKLFDQTFDADVKGTTSIAISNRSNRIFWNGKEQDWHPDFRIFLISALTNPHFDANVSGRTTIIDASMTLQGLEDQLLHAVVRNLYPTLERSRLEFLATSDGLRKDMDNLDKMLLNELSESEGNLLDNDELMRKLNEMKTSLGKVDEKLLEAEDAEADVLKSYEEYRPVAVRGALLYFALVSMAELDKMYQVSMSLFDSIFQSALKWKEANTTLEEKLVVVANDVTHVVLKIYSLCYARQHRNVFELTVALRMGLSEQQWEGNVDFLNCLSKCGSGLEISLVQRKPKDWIPDSAWLNLVFLVDKIPRCRSFLDSIVRKEMLWRLWFEKEMPEMEPVPEHDALEPVFKLLLIRALREDRIIAAAREFSVLMLGEVLPVDFFGSQNQFDIHGIWTWSTPQRPIIILADKGTSPTTAVLSLAKVKNVPVGVVSMGEGTLLGDSSPLYSAMRNYNKVGGWLVLENAHLVPAIELEKNLALASEDDFHIERQECEKSPMLSSYKKSSATSANNYRMWITTQKWDSCPSTLILRSIRVTYQAPCGVRETMLKLYEEYVLPEHIKDKSRAWARQLYNLSVCYSIMLQRQNYGSSAWSMPFDLDFSDWVVASSYLKTFVFNDQNGVEPKLMIKNIRCVLAEVVLGPMLEDDWDKKILKTLLESTITENMFGSDAYELMPGCRVPVATEVNLHQSFMEAIQELPTTDSSALLGLSSSAELLRRLETCQQMITQLSSLTPQTTSPISDVDMEAVVTEIATNMLAKIPSPWSPEQLKGKGKKADKTALHALMLQEVERMQDVLRTVRSTLQSLLLSISGAMPLSEKMRKVLHSLFDAVVPDSWISCSWNVSSLGEWIAVLMQRQEQLSKWIGSRPKSFWIAGLFNPASLFTALKQDAVRRNEKSGWTIDQLTVVVVVGVQPPAEQTQIVPDHLRSRRTISQIGGQALKSELQDLEDTITITGVSLDGASWSPQDRRLVDSMPKTTFSDFPKLAVTVFREINDEEKDQVKNGAVSSVKDAVAAPGLTRSEKNAATPSSKPERPAEKSKKPEGIIKDTHGVVYYCPCYAGPKRTRKNHIFDVPFVTSNPQEVVRWTLLGVALLTCKY